MAAQSDGHGHLRHVLPAHQLGADAGQFALMPLRMRSKQSLSHHQPQHRVAQKLKALIVSGILRLIYSPPQAPARWQRNDASARAPAVPAWQNHAQVRLPVQKELLPLAPRQFPFLLMHRSGTAEQPKIPAKTTPNLSIKRLAAARWPPAVDYCGFAVPVCPGDPVSGLADPAPDGSSCASSSQLWPLTA